MECPEGTIKKELDYASLIGIFVITIITVMFIFYYLLFKYQKNYEFRTNGKFVLKNKKSPEYTNLYERLREFLDGSMNRFTMELLIAILASSVIQSFNGWIINPLIDISIPDKNLLINGYYIGRNTYIYPGQFLLSFLGFIISIMVFFVLLEIVYQISWYKTLSKILKYSFMFLIAGMIIALLIWNIQDLSKTKCEAPPPPGALRVRDPMGPVYNIKFN